MDIEERLEQAERSETPSLVGSSIRSADDSSHNNYIHPEKYHSAKDKSKLNHYSNLSSAITASLDDLINEGALLGSEADFDKFLEQDGSVKTDATYTAKEGSTTEEEPKEEQPKEEETPVEEKPIEAEKEVSEESLGKSTPPETASNSAPASSSGTTGSSSFYKQEDYSTPNLSEFQLEHDIKDQTDLLDHVQSYDLQKLPTSASASNSRFRNLTELPLSQSQQTLLSPAQQQRLEDGGQLPYLHTERARSRSRSANPTARIREKSSSSASRAAILSQPHLARGDSYKSTHDEEPSKYELPGDLDAEAPKQLDERRSRQSRPTMGDSIAAAEAKAEALARSDNPAFEVEHPLPRDPSLVTSGDYTNFEVDTPKKEEPLTDTYFSRRSESATNYLRSISRSRSRARNPVQDEKNDSNNDALQREGALVSDDPYDTIDKLDAMMEEVLSLKDSDSAGASKKKEVKPEKTTHEELIEEDIEKARKQSNEKDDANTDVLVEEGALVNEDECTLIDKKDLEKEGISTEEEAPLNIKKKDVKPEADESEDEKPKEIVDKTEKEEKPEEEEEVEGESQEAVVAKVDEEEEKEAEEKKLKRRTLKRRNEPVEKEVPAVKPVVDDVKEDAEEPVAKETDEEPKEEDTVEDQRKKIPAAEEPKAKEVVEEPKDVVEEPKAKAGAAVVDDDDLDDLDISPEEIRKHLESQPIYIFTSLAGGMQIMPRTNRLATILQANGIKFEYRDLGTDEEAKKIWKRQANGKTLPGVVRGDDCIGNWHDIDEANEEYKLRELLYCSSQLKFSHTPARLVVHDEPTEEDKKELQRKINLTHLVDALKAHVPDILETSLPKSIIARDIYLRICPSQVDETYVPKLSGQVTYYATCKAIQLFLTSVILSPKVKLHVQSVRVVEGSGAAGGGGGGGGGGGPTGVDPQCMFEGTTKVYVRWSTCVHGCEHLEEHGTSEAHLGSHKWSEEDTKKIFDNQKGKSVSSIVSRLPGMIMGVLSGLFIFELDEDNSKVLVHTIENMEIIERFEPKEQEDVNALRVC
ncbi:hypothetical protein Cantr_06963 [Candida viswanathii]|uniref:Uncharacterized protein n=1 Tax=Candida viswanathii TaxID=5486 RepID=A0A367XVL5_9ASCO|nr:hypothetical protein Cantr_06963 [Candida viswanathii]